MIAYDIPKRLWMFDLGSASGKKKANNQHMFQAIASSPNSTIEVVVTDAFGNKYHQTMERPKPFHLHIK